jgi:polysaccharide biosynthesis/export protein
MIKSFDRRFEFAVLFLFALFFASCASTKRTKYFQDIPDSGALKTIVGAQYTSPTIQVDDILTILIQTVDPTATMSINAGNLSSPGSTSPAGGATSAPQSSGSSGYLVNKDGNVEIPILGSIKVVGLTTEQAREAILKEAFKYFNAPTVVVRYANFKFSVTGEVQKPGVYVIPNEKVSVLDAIALAGDLTIYGKRDNVLLIRENLDGSKTPYRIDLRRSDIISAPYYYLRQNDLIYVEPAKSKAAATDATQSRLYTIAAAVITVIIVIITRIK